MTVTNNNKFVVENSIKIKSKFMMDLAFGVPLGLNIFSFIDNTALSIREVILNHTNFRS